MTDAFLLQDLWFHHAFDAVLNTVAVRGELVTVQAAATTVQSECPACGASSARVHSRCVRRLDDTAAGRRRVIIESQVRRFRCGQQACPQVTFAEQIPGLTCRHGRRSQNLQTALRHVAPSCWPDCAGTRLADAFTVPVSRLTLLRLIRALPETASPRRTECSAWTSSLCARATSTRRSWSTSRPAAPSICCPSAASRPSPAGWPITPASR